MKKEREHFDEESEVERLAELRRKGRGKGHLLNLNKIVFYFLSYLF